MGEKMTPEQCEKLIGHCWPRNIFPPFSIPEHQLEKRTCQHCALTQERSTQPREWVVRR
jgi:hypothetical protein